MYEHMREKIFPVPVSFNRVSRALLRGGIIVRGKKAFKPCMFGMTRGKISRPFGGGSEILAGFSTAKPGAMFNMLREIASAKLKNARP